MTAEAKLFAALIASVILALSVTLGMNYILRLQAKAALADTRAGTLAGTSTIIGASDQSTDQRNIADNGVAHARDDYNHKLDQVAQHDPIVANRQRTVVPDSLRSLAHERRLARERLGRPRIGSEEQPAAALATQR